MKCKAMKILLLTIIIGLSSPSFANKNDFRDVDFSIADSIALDLAGYSIKNIPELSGKLTNSLSTDVQKFRAVYRWVCENIENDYFLYAINKQKREKYHGKPDKLKKWNAKLAKKVRKKLINENKTVCTGYAYLVKELAYYAGLKCVIIDGYGRTANSNIGGPGYQNHSWNAVMLDSSWYLCDATWSSGSIDSQKSSFIKGFDDAYFLADPKVFIQNHYPTDIKWSLLDSTVELRYFLDAPLIYKGAVKNGLIMKKPTTFNNLIEKGNALDLEFTFDGKFQNEDIVMEIIQRSRISKIIPELKSNDIGRHSINYTFYDLGEYDVHLKSSDEYLVTVNVKVVK